MSTTLLTSKPATEKVASSARGSVGRHEAELHLVQAELLDRELGLRKQLLVEIGRVIGAFERVHPLLAKLSPVLAAYPQQLQAVRKQIAEMKGRELSATLPDELPLGDVSGAEATHLRENALRAVANSEYFRLFPLLQVLASNLHGLLSKVAQSHTTLAAPLTQAAKEIETVWAKVAPLGGALAVRRVVVDESNPHPDEVRQAQAMWAEVLEKNKVTPYLQSLRPHESKPGPLRVAFISIGGLGDALLQTPCVAQVRRKLGPCEIVFIHSRGVVHPLFAGNRTVEATLYAEDRLIVPLPEVLKKLSIFDIVFESRFIIWGERCHESRITPEQYGWLRETQRHLTTFAPYLERFPQYSNLFARLVRPKMLLDVHGMSTGLPVSVESPLVICPAENDVEVLAQHDLRDGSFVTVHDGFDEGFGKMMGISRCTKQLPAEKWHQLINSLRADGLKVVQVGAANEPLLPEVDLDLRGKTTLSQLCFVLKAAVVHLDTEGGIVHMARAVHKRAIVFFGPTSVTFWGYPQNINLCSDEYADHWWINFDWMARAPIRQKRSAMDAFDVSSIPKLVAREQEIAENLSFRLQWFSDWGSASVKMASHPNSATNELLAAGGNEAITARVAVVGPPPADFRAHRWAAAQVDCFDVAPIGLDFQSEDRPEGWSVHRGSLYNIPANSGTYDVVVCASPLIAALFKDHVIKELVRLLKPGGTLLASDREATETSIGRLQSRASEINTEAVDDVSLEMVIAEICRSRGPNAPSVHVGAWAGGPFAITRQT